MFKYLQRSIALTYFFFLGTSLISRIGEFSTPGYLNWHGAWTFLFVVAVAFWLGWQVRKEVEDECT